MKQSHGVLPLTNACQDVQKKIATTLQYSTICSNIFYAWAAEEPYWVWRHWVKGQGHPGQMYQNRLSNNFRKWISSSYICATYFEQTNPVVQNICFGIMFYKHLLLFEVLKVSRIWTHIYYSTEKWYSSKATGRKARRRSEEASWSS